jgi:hypothetical protein
MLFNLTITKNEGDQMQLYVSLEEARVELKRRWADVDLKKRIEAELGDRFMPAFANKPRAVSLRNLSPDNGFTFFYQCAKYINAEPLALEYHGDLFVSFNQEKIGLGRLRVTQADGTKATLDIMNFHDNEKKPLADCLIKSGERLVAFHHKLVEISGYAIESHDNTEWFRAIGRAADFYYPSLLHCVAHGIFFEALFDETEGGDERDVVFTDTVIMPAMNKIKAKFGVYPLIAHSFPPNQTDEEDFYWWSYPPHVNQYLLDYAQSQQLKLKPVVFK